MNSTLVHHGGIRLPMSQLGHVWTAPWQELSDVSAALVGCGHLPRNDRICITSLCPRQFVETPLVYAAGSNLGSLNRSPRTIMAQAMRAILFASATAATLSADHPLAHRCRRVGAVHSINHVIFALPPNVRVPPDSD